MRKIQNIAVFINNKVAQLSLDSGCEGDCITLAECQRLNIVIAPLDSSDCLLPTQADGKSPLKVLGKAQFVARRGKIDFFFNGYVTSTLQSPILCGGSFLERNFIVQELHKKRIVVGSKYYIEETPSFCPNPNPTVDVSPIYCDINIRNKVGCNEILFALPKDTVDVILPNTLDRETEYIVSPIYDTDFKFWYPQLLKPKNSEIAIKNVSHEPAYWNRNINDLPLIPTERMTHFLNNDNSSIRIQETEQVKADLSRISIDPMVPKNIKEKLLDIHARHSKVFDDNLSEGYNGYAGDFTVDFNFLKGAIKATYM